MILFLLAFRLYWAILFAFVMCGRFFLFSRVFSTRIWVQHSTVRTFLPYQYSKFLVYAWALSYCSGFVLIDSVFFLHASFVLLLVLFHQHPTSTVFFFRLFTGGPDLGHALTPPAKASG